MAVHLPHQYINGGNECIIDCKGANRESIWYELVCGFYKTVGSLMNNPGHGQEGFFQGKDTLRPGGAYAIWFDLTKEELIIQVRNGRDDPECIRTIRQYVEG